MKVLELLSSCYTVVTKLLLEGINETSIETAHIVVNMNGSHSPITTNHIVPKIEGRINHM